MILIHRTKLNGISRHTIKEQLFKYKYLFAAINSKNNLVFKNVSVIIAANKIPYGNYIIDNLSYASICQKKWL